MLAAWLEAKGEGDLQVCSTIFMLALNLDFLMCKEQLQSRTKHFGISRPGFYSPASQVVVTTG